MSFAKLAASGAAGAAKRTSAFSPDASNPCARTGPLQTAKTIAAHINHSALFMIMIVSPQCWKCQTALGSASLPLFDNPCTQQEIGAVGRDPWADF
jgi:hypothetical protein